MLNIPESIKTLYKTDGVHKRFRAHFPGGELPDITNSDIIRESLHYTESICSQNVFRFGLAEASVLEFETVGVGNMYGYTFEASIGIDTDSLTAEDLAEITSGSWDGSLSSGVFWMPLGTFRVESCPRNHGAMTHRKVTAYSVTPNALTNLNQYEQYKLKQLYNANSISGYTVRLKRYVDAQILAQFGKEPGSSGTLASAVPGYSLMLYKAYAESDGVRNILLLCPVYKNGSQVGQVQITARYNYYALSDGEIYSSYMVPYDCREAVAEHIVTAVRNVDALSSVDTTNVRYLTDAIAYYDPYNVIIGQNISDKVRAVYPGGFGSAPELRVLVYVTVSGYIPTWGTGRPSSAQYGQIYWYEYTGGDAIDSVTVTFPPTSTQTIGSTDYVSFVGAVDLQNIATGLYELSGQFLQTSLRRSTIRAVELDPSSPAEIVPGDYDEVWWDEYDISPLASVIVTYGDNTVEVRLENVDGESVYEMADNAVLELGINEDVATVLNGTFAENAANVGFTPIELTMQGWPWLEAGDALQITAEDGTVVNSYALRVEMQGLQHLQSYITADGGEIIAEV